MRPASAVLAVSALVVSGVIFWHPSQYAASAQPGDGAVHLAESKKGQAKKQDAAQKKTAPKEAGGNSSGMPLACLFEQQKKEPPNRKLEVNLLRNDFFILSGMQGLKKFYVRAEIRDLEIRGMTILYDQATDGIMDAVTVVMSSAFAPFPGTGLTALAGPAPRRKVEYGTGIVTTVAGHILTDRALTDGCNVIAVSGHGDAELVA